MNIKINLKMNNVTLIQKRLPQNLRQSFLIGELMLFSLCKAGNTYLFVQAAGRGFLSQ